MDVAHAKTQARFEQLAKSVRGDFGLVAEDLRGEHQFLVNADAVFPQASAIKIPILMALLQRAHAGEIALAERRAITAASKTAGSGVLAELTDGGTELSLEDLAVLMILVSDNTATNILIDKLGLDAVNGTLAELGLEQTRLRRRMMDTAASARGEENTSTPNEAARIMRLLAERKFVAKQVSDHALAILRKPKKCSFGACLPAGVAIACKPGGIPGVATEWALVELPGRPYIVCAMGNLGDDQELAEALQQTGAIAYDFFSRIAHATPLGTYVEEPRP